MSLFLVIMKCDYANLLTWPFKRKVTAYIHRLAKLNRLAITITLEN